MNLEKLKQAYHDREHQQGVSLVELMVAMTLGLFLIWGVTQSFLTSRQVYTMQQGLARIQENGRMAQEFLGFDIRNAGDYGCAAGDNFVIDRYDFRSDTAPALAPGCGSGVSPNIAGSPGVNMIKNINSIDDEFEYPVYGFDNVASAPPTNYVLNIGAVLNLGAATATLSPPPKAGTDVLMIHTSDDVGVLSASFPSGATVPPKLANIASLTLVKGVPYPMADTPAKLVTDRIAVSDCATTKIFAINAVAVNATTIGLGSTPAPNFCRAAAFSAGATVRKLSTVYYYVADNGRGTVADPSYSLYRQNGDFAVTATAAEEVMEGVEDMQLTFGIDNVGNADGVIDIYKAPNDLIGAAPNTAALWSSAWNSWDSVTLAGPPPFTRNEYSLVRAVRYSLLMRTESDNLLRTPQQLSYNGAIFVSPDKRLRQVFTGTVGIRSQYR